MRGRRTGERRTRERTEKRTGEDGGEEDERGWEKRTGEDKDRGREEGETSSGRSSVNEKQQRLWPKDLAVEPTEPREQDGPPILPA